MADAVRGLTNLKVVHFEDCLMRTEGVKALAAAMEAGHEGLEELLLGHNEIRVEGGMAILNVVVRKRGLKKIDLNGERNGQGAELKRDIDNVSKSLRSCRPLLWCSLVLHSCCVCLRVSHAQFTTCSFLPGNCFGEGGCQQIQDFVDSNGLADVFEPLDEDEGSEEEDEEEGDEDEGRQEVQRSEEEELGDGEEGRLVKDKQLQMKVERIDADHAASLAAEEDLRDVSSASRTD